MGNTTTRRLRSNRVALSAPSGGISIAPACLEIRGGRIQAILAYDADNPLGHPSEDLGDLLVTPAFVDAHTHLAMAAMRGIGVDAAADGNIVEDLFFGLESRLTPEDVRAFTRVGAYEALLHGTALVWDHYYHGEAVASGLMDAGLAGVVAPTLQDISGPGADSWEEALAATLRIAGDTELAGRGIFASLGPHAPDTVSPELVRRIADCADAHQLPVHVHVGQSVDEVRLIRERYDTTPTGHLRELIESAPTSLLVHGVWCTDAEIANLAGTRAHMVVCPGSALIFAWPARIDRWRDAGLPWSIGTDCPVCNDG
ncbi:MAG: amidohydrolase family protein, partial [Myxococcota bacterium]|nr:amidohydrolase family protein [Myxococcota bacterium]